MLDSVVNQTHLPNKVVVVNDNSTDNSAQLISTFTERLNWMSSINITTSKEHTPGTKVINAFYKGLDTLDDNYDIICKFDADIILPINYLENIVSIFKSDQKIGIAGGLAFIEKNGNWIYETVSSKEHVRGPFKAYRKDCFKDIGGLKSSVGWDTVDVLLAQFNGWNIYTDKNLKVKHLKPTGVSYSNASKFLQGEALYKMRYGFVLACITALKSAINKRSISYFFNALNGYFRARKRKTDFLVTEVQGNFIRKLRWKGIFKKLI